MRPKLIPTLAVALFLLLPSSKAFSSAHEEEMDSHGAADMEAARAHFQEGQKKYRLGEYSEALTAFASAYEAWPHAAFLFNIAQCHRHLGNHAAALYFFRAYLQGVPEADNEEAVLALIEESKKVLADAGEEDVYDPPPEFYALGDTSKDDSLTAAYLSSAKEDEESTSPAPPEAVSMHDHSLEEPARNKWWVWTAVGVIAAGTVVTVGLAARSDSTWEMDLRDFGN